jgi:hypothetical protein
MMSEIAALADEVCVNCGKPKSQHWKGETEHAYIDYVLICPQTFKALTDSKALCWCGCPRSEHHPKCETCIHCVEFRPQPSSETAKEPTP